MKVYGLLNFDNFSVVTCNKTGQLCLFDTAKDAHAFLLDRLPNPEKYKVATVDINFYLSKEVPVEALQ